MRATADGLARSARTVTASAREQRRASEARPPATVVRRTGREGGRLVQRVGRPDAAIVVVLVPGVGTDPADARRLRADAGRVWSAVASAGRDPAEVAVVSWLGYDPPDVVVGALDPRPADRGARALVEAVAGLRAGGAHRVVVVGHSYGGVVVGRALGAGLDADGAVFLGSPGTGGGPSGGRSVEVRAARAAGDPIALVRPWAGVLYGPDPVDRHPRLATSLTGHGAYLRDPVLLDGLADLATGAGGPVRSGDSSTGGAQWGSR
jgi:pimeloyl-ACP methyl ester carboxylesterase